MESTKNSSSAEDDQVNVTEEDAPVAFAGLPTLPALSPPKAMLPKKILGSTKPIKVFELGKNLTSSVLKSIQQDPENLILLRTGVWALCAMSSDRSSRTRGASIQAAEVLGTIFRKVEAEKIISSELLLPVCGFYASVCTVPGLNPEVIPFCTILGALQILPDDEKIASKVAADFLINFCKQIPSKRHLIGDAIELTTLEQTLRSSNGLSQSFGEMLTEIAACSDTFRNRMARKPGILEGLLSKLIACSIGSDKLMANKAKLYLQLLAIEVTEFDEIATTISSADIVGPILKNLDNHTDAEIQSLCLLVLRNVILSGRGTPEIHDEVVNSIFGLMDHLQNENRPSIEVEVCAVLWALADSMKMAKSNDTASLVKMKTCIMQTLSEHLDYFSKHRGRGPFDFEVLSMATGALDSITKYRNQNSALISNEDLEQIVLVLRYSLHPLELQVRMHILGKGTQLQVRILSSVYNLSCVSETCEKLAQCGAITALTNVMMKFGKCLEVQQLGCATLANVTENGHPHDRIPIVIVNALALFTEDEIVQSQACRALLPLVGDESEPPKYPIDASYLLRLITNIMKNHTQGRVLMLNALSVVHKLSSDPYATIEPNVAEVIDTVMETHSSTSEIQSLGKSVLQSISKREGGIELPAERTAHESDLLAPITDRSVPPSSSSLLSGEQKTDAPKPHPGTSKTDSPSSQAKPAALDRQFDRFGTYDAIPHFNSSGTALFAQADREQIAKRRGLCVRCGIKTYNVTMIRRTPITNESVYKGHCRSCEEVEDLDPIPSIMGPPTMFPYLVDAEEEDHADDP